MRLINGKYSAGLSKMSTFTNKAAQRRATVKRALANGWDPNLKEAQALAAAYLRL